MKPERANLLARPLTSPEQARVDALHKILQLRESAARLAQEPQPKSFLEGAFQLCKLRSAIYENLNQFPHEVLVLEAQRQLAEKPEYHGLKWHWHPRQTSGDFETDLMGWREEQLIVVAEANTSSDPKGTIRDRIKKALANLANVTHPAARFFFCYSERCANVARGMINRTYPTLGIQVVLLHADAEVIKD